MREILQALPAAGVGLVVGVVFFRALEWTVRKGMTTRRPALLFAGSFVVRTAAAVAAIAWVSSGDLVRLLASLAGFVIGRQIVLYRRAPVPDTASGPEREQDGGNKS